MRKRRPYITYRGEQELFNAWATQTQSKKQDLLMRYSKNEKMKVIKSLLEDLSLKDSIIKMCNDDISSMAMQDVYWLQHCIVYGVFSAEIGEKLDFIEDEIRDIVTNNHIERLRDRLWPEDIVAMERDLKIAGEFYGILP